MQFKLRFPTHAITYAKVFTALVYNSGGVLLNRLRKKFYRGNILRPSNKLLKMLVQIKETPKSARSIKPIWRQLKTLCRILIIFTVCTVSIPSVLYKFKKD